MRNPDTHNMYFVALVCPPEIDNKIQKHKLWMRDHFGCAVALRSPAHVTLIPPFWLALSAEEKLVETLQTFETDKLPVDIQLKNFSHFSNRVIFIAVTENHQLGTLRKETEDHFIQPFRAIIKPDDRPFYPHVTIANRDLKPGLFPKAWACFEHEPFNETFSAHHISLLKLGAGKWNVLVERHF